MSQDGQSFPDELRGMTEEERKQRAQELQHEAKEAGDRLSSEQADLLESLEEEHGGDLIETSVTLPGDNPATVECNLNGELLDRMSAIDAALAKAEGGEPGDLQNIGRSMEEAADVLAELTVEAKYSKTVFYEIYRTYGPDALGEHVEAIFGAIEQEVERQAGEAKGFRKK